MNPLASGKRLVARARPYLTSAGMLQMSGVYGRGTANVTQLTGAAAGNADKRNPTASNQLPRATGQLFIARRTTPKG